MNGVDFKLAGRSKLSADLKIRIFQPRIAQYTLGWLVASERDRTTVRSLEGRLGTFELG